MDVNPAHPGRPVADIFPDPRYLSGLSQGQRAESVAEGGKP